jgi:hypothetical protein
MVVLDYFSYKNGPNDLVWDFFSSLDIRTYMPSTCGPLSTLKGPFEGAQMPQKSIKNYFLVVLDYFSFKNGPNDLVRGLKLYSSLDIETYFRPTCGPSSTSLGSFSGAQSFQNSIKKLFSGCFGLFLLQEWA